MMAQAAAPRSETIALTGRRQRLLQAALASPAALIFCLPMSAVLAVAGVVASVALLVDAWRAIANLRALSR